MRRAGPAALAAAIVSLASLKFLPAPFIWAGLAWSACLAYVAVTARRSLVQVVLIAAAAAATTGTGLETWLWLFRRPPPEEVLTPPGFYPDDSILGWRARPGATHAVKRASDRVIYDVVYTIDSSGWRVLPPDTARTAAGCAILFADSFTFGQGLRDDQALPWLVRLGAMGRFRVFSLSSPGYGNEQMLAALERGLMERLPCRPTLVVYQAIIDHVLRAAGGPFYARRGPHYELRPDGTLEYLGTGWPATTPRPGAVAQRLLGQLGKSRLYSAVHDREPLPTDADFRLYFAILGRFRTLLEARYPGARLHVLAWRPLGRFARFAPQFLGGLERVAQHVHPVDDVLPGYRANPVAYHNDVTDEHPNARADTLLADYVLRCILRTGSVRGVVACPG